MSEFDISFKSRKALKAQMFVDFIAKLTLSTLEPAYTWVVFTNMSSNSPGSGVGLILENEVELIVEESLCFMFSTTKNQAEYEAVIVGLMLTVEMGGNIIRLRIDSQLMVSYIKEEAHTKESLLQQYVILAMEKLHKFNTLETIHVRRKQNT